MNTTPKIKILIVDDDDDSRTILSHHLSQNNMDPIIAINAEEGIKIATTVMPDIILMDILMPGLDGKLAIKRLRESDQTKNIPVFAISAFALEEDKDRCFEAGCEEFFQKPIAIQELVNKITAYRDKAA